MQIPWAEISKTPILGYPSGESSISEYQSRNQVSKLTFQYISFNPDTEDTERKYNFPPYDLIPSLVTLYFAHVNPFLPLLHRPTFERGITRGLHLTDSYFGATVLLVCALGSKYSDDPRVFVEGSNSTRSAGWHWYEQVRNLRSSFFARASLHELQAHVVSGHQLCIWLHLWPFFVWFAIALYYLFAIDWDTTWYMESNWNGVAPCAGSRCSQA